MPKIGQRIYVLVRVKAPITEKVMYVACVACAFVALKMPLCLFMRYIALNYERNAVSNVRK